MIFNLIIDIINVIEKLGEKTIKGEKHMKKRKKKIIILITLFFILTTIGIFSIFFYKDENITTTPGEITKSLMEMDFQITENFNNHKVIFDVDVNSEEDVNRRQNKDIRGWIHFEPSFQRI